MPTVRGQIYIKEKTMTDKKDTMQFAHVADLDPTEAQTLGIDIQAQDSKYIEEQKFNEQLLDTANKPAEFAKDEEQKNPEETRGRKKIELDEDLLFKLAECHCSVKEIAYIMGVSAFTLRNRYQHVMDRGFAAGKMRLRKAQYRKALEGNPVMLIWLGKNVLGQKDDPNNGEEDLPLPWVD
tara:strand:+ start:84 stop:626 length:543 start_codon:yes stop_codon:yes gene_type:complete